MAFAGSSGLIQVGVAMTLHDNFSRQAGVLSKEFRTMMNDVRNYSQALQMSNYGFQAATSAVQGMVGTYRKYADSQKEGFLAATMSVRKTDPIYKNSIEGRKKALEDLMVTARKVNAETPLSYKDITSGMKFMAMAGNTTRAIQNMIKPAAQLASIFSMPLGGKGGVADLMTNIGATFGLPQTVETYQKMADTLMTATTMTNTSLPDLANSIKYAGAEFRSAGIDLKNGAALIGVLGDMGIQGSSAGTALANQMRYLVRSITGVNGKGQEQLKKMQIPYKELVDADGNLKDISKVIEVIAEALKRQQASGMDKSVFYSLVFGTRGSRAIDALIADYMRGGPNGQNSKLHQVLNAYAGNEYRQDTQGNVTNQGITAQTLYEYNQTPQGRLDKLRSTYENFIMTVGESLIPVLNPLTTIITKGAELLGWMANNGIGKFIAGASLLVTIGGSIVTGLGIIRGTWGLLLIQLGQGVTQTNANAGAQTRWNARLRQAILATQLLDRYLREAYFMMVQMAAINLAPGQRFMMAGGSSVSRGKNGSLYYGNAAWGGRGTWEQAKNQAFPKGSAFPSSLMFFGGRGGGGPVPAPTPAPTPPTLGPLGKITRFLSGPMTKALGFLTGPWGMALSIGLPLITSGVGYLVDKFTHSKSDGDKAAEATNAQTQQQALMYQDFQRGLTNSVAQGMDMALNKHPMNVNIIGGGGYSGGANVGNQDPNQYGLFS